MNNKNGLTNRRLFAAGLLFALALGISSCSAVFRSSIQGRILDQEEWNDGNTEGISDARVFLYTNSHDRNSDYAAFAEWDESTLPDRAQVKYFQSTVTDTNGNYDFSGFVWETFNAKYGKTADRYEVFLLIYHPDYGLWKNPSPVYVVSDVTNQIDDIRIEDLYNEGRLSGKVLDWKNGKGLGGVTINFYVAKAWTYDGSNFENIVWPNRPTSSTSSSTNAGSEGNWSATVRFPMKPNRAAHSGSSRAPVRITFVRDNYRANVPDGDTGNYAGFSNTNIETDWDINKDGLDAEHRDYAEAYIQTELSYNTVEKEAELTPIEDITLQRWLFSTTVSGRVKNSSTPPVYLNGKEVVLAFNLSNDETYRAVSGPTDGHYDLGTITWKIDDITTDEDKQKSGEIGISIKVDNGDPSGGAHDKLLPDAPVTMDLTVTL